MTEKLTQYEKARIYLARYRSTVGRIEHLRRCIRREEERIRQEYGLIPALPLDKPLPGKKQGAVSDPTLQNVILIIDRLRKSLENMQADLIQLEYMRDEADELLKQVPWDPDTRTVIELYYLLPEPKANWQIGVELNVGERTVNRIKREGIQVFALFCKDLAI